MPDLIAGWPAKADIKSNLDHIGYAEWCCVQHTDNDTGFDVWVVVHPSIHLFVFFFCLYFCLLSPVNRSYPVLALIQSELYRSQPTVQTPALKDCTWPAIPLCRSWCCLVPQEPHVKATQQSDHGLLTAAPQQLKRTC